MDTSNQFREYTPEVVSPALARPMLRPDGIKEYVYRQADGRYVVVDEAGHVRLGQGAYIDRMTDREIAELKIISPVGADEFGISSNDPRVKEINDAPLKPR